MINPFENQTEDRIPFGWLVEPPLGVVARLKFFTNKGWDMWVEAAIHASAGMGKRYVRWGVPDHIL